MAISAKSASGCSYKSHMILAASIAEPPPIAIMTSGSKLFISSAPALALLSVGLGSTSLKVV